MNIAIGICTKDRPKSLRELIESINGNDMAERTLIICDSSNKEHQELNIESARKYVNGPVIFIQSEPGLTIQRNKILEYVRENKYEILHFIDDDVEVEDNYFEELEKVLAIETEVALVGARISNIPKPFFPLFQQGRILKNGTAQGIYSLKGDQRLDWVPGLSMTIKIPKIHNIYFDERRKGNAIGEDADFCIKVSRQAKIMWTDRTSLKHKVEKIGRYSVKKNLYASNLHRYLLSLDFPDIVKKRHILLHDFCNILKYFLLGIFLARKRYIKISLETLNFLIDSKFYSINLGEIDYLTYDLL
jgi:GT2 family glycosyltransferase